ncbi:amidohydrolase family protein [Ornithinimicrobium humiphilum]|uniref:Imidazolonepropionase-like amidohydrolase n=1 Tax=Ornithinimicrobium humiphilum TaxID=125288 RepID=A0A543KN92_9MICO|nr:amidohydrolase family protein [Ornithinimicrobium humiphilum]TQM96545.1 imidazolonepropionase-like amidohydrolase [Ornithinimicrobium humiphilum]
MTSILFRGGTVLDGTGAAPSTGDVHVVDGRVAQVGTDLGVEADQVVDCTGATVLPGLFDCHVHFMFEQPDLMRVLQTPFSLPFFQAAHRMRATLETGITWVRDAGGADLGVAEAVRRGLTPGPRMQIAINMLSQTGGHGDDWHVCGAVLGLMSTHPGVPDSVVDGPEEMRKRVRELIRAGADVIKVATSGGVLSPLSNPLHGHFRDDEIAALVTEASAAGLHVMAHAQATDGIKTAVRGGIRSIEHGIYLDDEAIDLMLEHGTWLVPTLSAPRAVLAQAEAGAAISDRVLAKARMVAEVHDDSFRRAVEAGVKVAMGTDSGVGAHGTNLEEVRLMAELGLGAQGAWEATTRSAAELLGVDADHGTLEPGKVADVVVLDGAWDDLAGLRSRVRSVHVAGERVVDRDAGARA